MKIADIKKKFLENIYQDFDKINAELIILYNDIHKSIKNNYENLLYSNIKLDFLRKLKPEELFFMNIHDKYILAILNISIYQEIINEDYEFLYNGIYTYTHLRSLNRLHLEGFKLNEIFECLIINENRYIEQYNWKEYIVKRFLEDFYDQMNGKFDMEFVEILKGTVSNEKAIENNYNNLLKLHSKCQWLTKGWYRECNLINYMPIYLVGIYKFIGQNIKIETENKWFISFIDFLNKNKAKEKRLVYKFTGEISFLNSILDKDYNNFRNEYKNKCRYT
jgi:hypothetical protein